MFQKACSVLFAGAALFAAGAAQAAPITIDPDDFADGAVITAAGVTIKTAAGGDVYSVTGGNPSTGTRVFGNCATCITSWDGMFPAPNPYDVNFLDFPPSVLRVDFASGAGFVSIDVIPDDTIDPAILAAYDAGGNLVAVDSFDDTTQPAPGTARTLSVSGAIAFIVVGGAFGDTVDLDRLVYDTARAVPEPAMAALLGLGALGLIARRRRG